MLHSEAIAHSHYNKKKKVFKDAIEAVQAEAIDELSVSNVIQIVYQIKQCVLGHRHRIR